MSKILIAVLTAAAFFYALWLVVFRRPQPEPRKARGLKQRFYLAALLFVGWLGLSYAESPTTNTNSTPCMSAEEKARHMRLSKLKDCLESVWRTLEVNRDEEFRKQLKLAVQNKLFTRQVADKLATAYSALAMHKQSTRPATILCYEPSPTSAALIPSREKALIQLEALAKARASNVLDDETADKAQKALERELTMLYRAHALENSDNSSNLDQLIKDYEAGRLTPDKDTVEAARLIVDFEDDRPDLLHIVLNLADTPQEVRKLFMGEESMEGGPPGNDWWDPAIRPNLSQILFNTGLIDVPTVVTCYMRFASPVQARSDELKKLQQELLDKNVRAGVLDVEVAEKAAQATTRESTQTKPIDIELQEAQNNLRRMVRLLYQHGELPSPFVEKVEKAAGIEIIDFDPAKTLPQDARFYLRSMLGGSTGMKVLDSLTERKLIPPARNHRLETESTISSTQQTDLLNSVRKLSETSGKKYLPPDQQLSIFLTLIDNEEPFALEGDEKLIIRQDDLPRDQLAYRLKLRRVIRALIKADIIHPESGKTFLHGGETFQELQQVLGIPIIGTIEGQ